MIWHESRGGSASGCFAEDRWKQKPPTVGPCPESSLHMVGHGSTCHESQLVLAASRSTACFRKVLTGAGIANCMKLHR